MLSDAMSKGGVKKLTYYLAGWSKQTPEQLRDSLTALSKLFGGRVREVKTDGR